VASCACGGARGHVDDSWCLYRGQYPRGRLPRRGKCPHTSCLSVQDFGRPNSSMLIQCGIMDPNRWDPLATHCADEPRVLARPPLATSFGSTVTPHLCLLGPPFLCLHESPRRCVCKLSLNTHTTTPPLHHPPLTMSSIVNLSSPNPRRGGERTRPTPPQRCTRCSDAWDSPCHRSNSKRSQHQQRVSIRCSLAARAERCGAGAWWWCWCMVVLVHGGGAARLMRLSFRSVRTCEQQRG
jgi:hypothetical protein